MPLIRQRCPACGHLPSFERVACPACFGALESFESPGRGRVESFAVLRRAHDARFEPHLPIVLALIALEEGGETITTIVGDDRLRTAIGSPVEVSAAGWSTLPQFRLREGEAP